MIKFKGLTSQAPENPLFGSIASGTCFLYDGTGKVPLIKALIDYEGQHYGVNLQTGECVEICSDEDVTPIEIQAEIIHPAKKKTAAKKK